MRVRPGGMAKGFGTAVLEKGRGSEKSKEDGPPEAFPVPPTGARVTDGGGRAAPGGGGFVFLTTHV